MSTKTILISASFALMASTALAQSSKESIIEQLKQQGFTRIEISRTLFGNTRIEATGAGIEREIVLGREGTVMRDRSERDDEGDNNDDDENSDDEDDDTEADDDENDDNENDDNENDHGDDSEGNSGRGGGGNSGGNSGSGDGDGDGDGEGDSDGDSEGNSDNDGEGDQGSAEQERESLRECEFSEHEADTEQAGDHHKMRAGWRHILVAPTPREQRHNEDNEGGQAAQ